MNSLFTGDLLQCHVSKRIEDSGRTSAPAPAGSGGAAGGEGKRPWMKKIQALLTRKVGSGGLGRGEGVASTDNVAFIAEISPRPSCYL